ncbi:diguanylate cyclase [Reinekea sp.]|jgi:diguanylate cyclase (GGDEF)-like protein|uniref:GGDEF domain-containing response regulator n=1 Tax=Reinekea sp. TaxID=1970455 RepID=UPI002A831F2F|nr:diguanylate cyclase [Reinekea sp.]
MSDKQQQLTQLKLHFARRIYEQARNIVNRWGQLAQVHWQEVWFNDFAQAAGKLRNLAERHDFGPLAEAAQQLTDLLALADAHTTPSSEVLEDLNTAIGQIAVACSRANDNMAIQQVSAGRKPVYLCFSNADQAALLNEQMAFFGIPAQSLATRADLDKAILSRLPAAMVVDTQFTYQGVALVADLQQDLRVPIPVIFYSEEPPTVATRLAVVRANGIALYVGQVDADVLIEQLISAYSLRSDPPFRVLVVDDSRAQARYAEKTLNSAGLFTRNVNDPFEVLDVIESFNPDAILMDMYMPLCMGPELAQVIRQQGKYDAIPILYLSAESDIEKQLDAVGQGGDDFLTKPVAQNVLIATVLNRCRRYRGLRAQMIRDGLTGLVDHHNTLEELAKLVSQNTETRLPLTFVMIDLDRFKQVNDNYGHGMGDRVIRALALYLKQRFRLSDVIGRYGGEEFAVILPDTDEATAAMLLDEVRSGFEQLTHRDGQVEIHVTFSAGLATLEPGEDSSTLAQRADLALYRAKSNGRNQIAVASDLAD